MIRDNEGNALKEGDWFGFTTNSLVKGSILAAVPGGGIQIGNEPPRPGFITIAIQVLADPNGRINGSKIAGPPVNEG